MSERNFVGKKIGCVEFVERNGEVFGQIDGSGVFCEYKLKPVTLVTPAKAILMDLDGTTVTSEEFWMYIIEKTVKKVLGNNNFELEQADVPFVSGYGIVDHLGYCFRKYADGKQIDMNDAVRIYHGIAEAELQSIMQGKGRVDAFKPTEGLKDFLTEVKSRGVKIALVTSGLDYKAIPEITALFRNLNMGNPLEFYDSIMTGGRRKDVDDYGTLGEIAVKPHPWVYTEVAYMGLKIADPACVFGIEDSAAGVMALRFAGFPVVGLNSGNIAQSGADGLCVKKVDKLHEILKLL